MGDDLQCGGDYLPDDLLPDSLWQRGNLQVVVVCAGGDRLCALHHLRRLLHIQSRAVRNHARRLHLRSDGDLPGHHPAISRDPAPAGRS